MSYCGYIVKVNKLRAHPNADKLQLLEVFGTETCVSLDVAIGDVGLYLPCDGQLSMEFCIENHMLRKLPDGTPDTGYLDPDKRNVKAIKLRGERSDGIYLPIKCLDYCFDGKSAESALAVGDTITVVNGHDICQKYIPRCNPSKVRGSGNGTKKTRSTKQLPYFKEHIDTPQLRFCPDMFKSGDIICLTEKVHGTSSRNANTLSITYKRNWFDRLFRREGKRVEAYEDVIGTRRTVVANTEGGFYGSHQFRVDWGKKFNEKLHPGEEVFGEIAGWVNENTPIMGVANNKKVSDKEFVKKYGETTTFTYGCAPGESRFFIYRMTLTGPDGYVVEYPWDLVKLRAEQMGFEVVPELDRFIYTTEEDFNNRIQKWMDISSTLDPTHVIEGVVVRALNAPGFKVAKEKSYTFKVIESIIKDEAETPDLEEAEDILDENE